MSDYDKAIAELEKAGFECTGDSWGVSERWTKDEVQVQTGFGSPRASLAVPLSDLPALLNPITPEKVADAFWNAWHTTRSDVLDNIPASEMQRFCDAILARLRGDI